MEITIRKDRKPDIHERKKIKDEDTAREERLGIQGLLLDRPIGPLTLAQHEDVQQLLALEAHNTAIELVNLQDYYEEVGVVPFIDKDDGRPYIAAGELPKLYYFDAHDKRTCGVQTWKNMVVITGILLVLNGLASIIIWGLVDLLYPIGFMRDIVRRKESAFHAFMLEYSAGSTIAMISVWAGAWSLLCILCPRPNFMKSGFTLTTLSIIPVSLHAFLITASQRIVSKDTAELFEVLTRARGTYNQSVYWNSTAESGFDWDNVQNTLQCCGIRDYTDWKTSAWGDYETRLAKQEDREIRHYPESCCVQNENEVSRHRVNP